METKRYVFKSIGLYPDTYQELEKEGRMHESFNDVISRLLGELQTLRRGTTQRW